jgi:hypothetical protein
MFLIFLLTLLTYIQLSLCDCDLLIVPHGNSTKSISFKDNFWVSYQCIEFYSDGPISLCSNCESSVSRLNITVILLAVLSLLSSLIISCCFLRFWYKGYLRLYLNKEESLFKQLNDNNE